MELYENFINEGLKGELSYLPTQFWHKYLREGRKSIRMILLGKIVEFHTKSPKVKGGIYNGRIIGLMLALSKKFNKIIILFKTKEFGVLEVDVDFPIVLRYPEAKVEEAIRWYNKGKLGEREGPVNKSFPNDLRPPFIVGDRIKRDDTYYWSFDKWQHSPDRSDRNITDILYNEDTTKFDGYIGWLVKLGGKIPWYKAEDMELLYPNKLDEEAGIRWYKGGKLGEREKGPEPIVDLTNPGFNVGDIVVRIDPNLPVRFWSSEVDELHGDWMDGRGDTREITQVRLNEDRNLFGGYIGQLIKMSTKWPWFKADDNLRKITHG